MSPLGPIVGEGRVLYRSIMRLHRTKLPGPMRSLGDAYVRREFRLHYKPDVKVAHRQMFMREWGSYVETISSQASVVGKEMSEEQTGKLDVAQKKQLSDLEKTAKSLGSA
uniref:Succinate dehydrogenase assembly factor 3 n=1 Tax=Spumella elongata TaxID=89044 RepID=A0A7S3HCN5_9STRA|mmetsp:Transcript_125113/g.400718  ORF Transcript_125113/g.400718 Transcript_125113/m.400718 type:complete len:110 (-) Transcript_125113:67-396(-)